MDAKTPMTVIDDDEDTVAKKKKINWDKLNPDIEHHGRTIVLPGDPANMPTGAAIEALQRKLKDEEQTFRVMEVIDAFPYDGAVAFAKAMRKLYGWASPQTVMTFFGPKPPQMLSVKIGAGKDDIVQVPMGAFKLPGCDEQVHTMFYEMNGTPVFLIHGEIKKKDSFRVLEIAQVTREFVAAESIYRGKPIRLGVDEGGSLNLASAPDFLDVSEISEEHLIFDDDIQDQVDTNLLVPLRHTALCREHGIPLKRGVLLEGPYGTGKSLLARLTARVAELNGWTFILLDRVQGLRVALEFANRYAPAVVFAEDIDRMASERDEAANDLVNIIDGVVSKRSEVMTILTTNFVERLDPVILRPGRLDAVISVRAPSAEAVKRLIRHYAGNLLNSGDPLDGSSRELEGQIPASIRECTERAKLAMIGRNADTLSDKDLVIAALGMKNHLALLNRKAPELTDAERLAVSLKAVIGNGHDTATPDQVYEVDNNVDTLHRRVAQVADKVDAMFNLAMKAAKTAAKG